MTKEARAEIDKLFLIAKLLTSQALLENIDKSNGMIISENEKLVKKYEEDLQTNFNLSKPIIKHLMDKPILRCLYNYLAVFIKKMFGHSYMNLGELHDWCIDHCAIPPEF